MVVTLPPTADGEPESPPSDSTSGWASPDTAPAPQAPTWYFHPLKESWNLGDRRVLCYVTGDRGRDLKRSVVPD